MCLFDLRRGREKKWAVQSSKLTSFPAKIVAKIVNFQENYHYEKIHLNLERSIIVTKKIAMIRTYYYGSSLCDFAFVGLVCS